MKPHIEASVSKLTHGCDRADGLWNIFEYIKASAPAALDCSDILRSSLVLTVSAFDLFMHDIYRGEVLDRLRSGRSTPALKVPFDAVIASGTSQIELIDECISRENSYKSFVAPDKVADCLRVLVENPWDKISSELGESARNLKVRLKGVVDLRNRIAHEADVNPAYAGIELWPIYSADVSTSITFIRNLSHGIARVVDSNPS